MPISLNRFSYELDLSDELSEVPRSKHSKIKQDVGKILRDEITRHVKREMSPVEGEGKFEKLSKNYKKLKKSQGKGTKADLHLNSKMISSIKSKNTVSGTRLEITKKKEILKSFNHNTGDTLPRRQFMPDEELFEDFKPSILKKVDARINRDRVTKQDIERRERERVEEARIATAFSDKLIKQTKQGSDVSIDFNLDIIITGDSI